MLRKLAKVPVLGTVLDVLYSLYRLPSLRRQQLDINHDVKVVLPSDIRDLRSLLLDVNHDVKVVLPSRIENNSLTNGQISNVLSSLSDLNSRFANIENSMPVALRKMKREMVELENRLNQSSWVQESCTNLADSVGYLLKRVEFVRQEVMFEMRYGATGSGGVTEAIPVEVLAAEKLEKMQEEGYVKVNIGCGHVPLEGYLNVDRRKLPGVDIVADVANLPFSVGELSEIFSAHLLEHFPKEQLVRSILPYYFGLLKHGGVFRAVVPDAEAMIDAYKRGEYGFDRLREVVFGGQDYDGDFHFTMMTPDSMSELLANVGFQRVVVVASNRENGGCKEFEIVAERP